MIENKLKKRIKRHVIGPVQSFFAVTAPGLENSCYRELSAISGTIGHAEIIPGGVQLIVGARYRKKADEGGFLDEFNIPQMWPRKRN